MQTLALNDYDDDDDELSVVNETDTNLFYLASHTHNLQSSITLYFIFVVSYVVPCVHGM